jgi:hypothetical protein
MLFDLDRQAYNGGEAYSERIHHLHEQAILFRLDDVILGGKDVQRIVAGGDCSFSYRQARACTKQRLHMYIVPLRPRWQ